MNGKPWDKEQGALPEAVAKDRERLLAHLVLYLKLILTAVFWGGTFIAARAATPYSGPASAAFLRFAVASAFLAAFVLKSEGKIPMPQRRQILPVMMLALTGVFAYNIFFFCGLKTVPAGRASLIVACNPACITLFSCLVFREKIDALKISGILLSLLGASLVLSHGNPVEILRGGLGTGELYIVGCVASWVCYSLVGKVVMRGLSPLLSVTYACALGAILLLPPALHEGMAEEFAHYPFVYWAGIFYLGFFGSALGFIWYYEGIKAIGLSRAGIFINIVPVSAVAMAYVLLHEAVDASLAGGAVLVFLGVYLMNRQPRPRGYSRNQP